MPVTPQAANVLEGLPEHYAKLRELCAASDAAVAARESSERIAELENKEAKVRNVVLFAAEGDSSPKPTSHYVQY